DGPLADIVAVAGNVKTAYPRARLISVLTPTEGQPTFVALIQDRGRGQIRVAAAPASGAILGEFPRKKSWLDTVLSLHETLLMGISGRRLNGGAAAFLLLLNITGLVIWWPGIKTWTRAFKVDFARGWRRINFDTHRAVGFWTLAISSFWAVSGIYFGWPTKAFAWVSRVSPIVSARPPAVVGRPRRNAGEFDLHALVARAAVLDPGTSLMGIAFPSSRRAPLAILMRRRSGPGYEYADTLYFDPYDGSYIETWRYGVNQTLGDWFIWLQIPLHYGTYWGTGVKIIWALGGLTIALLTITGALMYWNRSLRKKWKRLREDQFATGTAKSLDMRSNRRISGE
ncbi:MAG: PepSY-associated TM helix domain-containing protein, partial [Bryobacteraceae bacterium]